MKWGMNDIEQITQFDLFNKTFSQISIEQLSVLIEQHMKIRDINGLLEELKIDHFKETELQRLILSHKKKDLFYSYTGLPSISVKYKNGNSNKLYHFLSQNRYRIYNEVFSCFDEDMLKEFFLRNNDLSPPVAHLFIDNIADEEFLSRIFLNYNGQEIGHHLVFHLRHHVLEKLNREELFMREIDYYLDNRTELANSRNSEIGEFLLKYRNKIKSSNNISTLLNIGFGRHLSVLNENDIIQLQMKAYAKHMKKRRY